MSSALATINNQQSTISNQQLNTLEQSILSTIVYYDCLDYPLTAVEIFRYLVNIRNQESGIRNSHPLLISPSHWEGEIVGVGDVIETLEKSEVLKKLIRQKNGFYFLAGREKIVQTRIQRKKLADEKWRKIKPVLELCLAVPYIRAIFVSGSLAQGNVKNQSDIDILVVAKYGRIWISRTFLTILLSLLGKYRQTKSTTDKVCPNHYITDKSLAIPFPSLYNAQTYVHFFAPDQKSNKYLSEFKKVNSWISNYLYNYEIPLNPPGTTSSPQVLIKGEVGDFNYANRDSFIEKDINLHTLKPSFKNRILLVIRNISELFLDNKLGDWLENKFRTFETNRIKKNELYQKSGGRITLSDEQLEFHPDSPEKIIVEKFNRKMRQLGFSQLANLKDSGLTP